MHARPNIENKFEQMAFVSKLIIEFGIYPEPVPLEYLDKVNARFPIDTITPLPIEPDEPVKRLGIDA